MSSQFKVYGPILLSESLVGRCLDAGFLALPRVWFPCDGVAHSWVCQQCSLVCLDAVFLFNPVLLK